MKKNQEIIIHKNQKDIYDFIKEGKSMDLEKIKQEVNLFIKEKTQIFPKANDLINDLKLSEKDLLECLLLLEMEFEIELPNDIPLNQIFNVNDFILWIDKEQK